MDEGTCSRCGSTEDRSTLIEMLNWLLCEICYGDI